MTRQLSELTGSDFLVRTAGRQIEEIFDGEVVIFLRDETGQLSFRFGEQSAIVRQPVNTVVAQWVATNGKTAGAGTDTLPNATALFVPLAGSQEILGALGHGSQGQGPVRRSRAGATAGNMRQLDRIVDRARPIDVASARSPDADRSGAASQFAAKFRVARFTHAAGHDCRHGFRPY